MEILAWDEIPETHKHHSDHTSININYIRYTRYIQYYWYTLSILPLHSFSSNTCKYPCLVSTVYHQRFLGAMCFQKSRFDIDRGTYTVTNRLYIYIIISSSTC